VHINRRPLPVASMAVTGQILVLRVISSFRQLSLSPLHTRAASRDLEIELTRLEMYPPCSCISPDFVSDKSGAVVNRADRMSLIDTNAEEGSNETALLRFMFRFFI